MADQYAPEPITQENVSRRSEELKVWLATNPPSYMKSVCTMLLNTVLTQMKPVPNGQQVRQ